MLPHGRHVRFQCSGFDRIIGKSTPLFGVVTPSTHPGWSASSSAFILCMDVFSYPCVTHDLEFTGRFSLQHGCTRKDAVTSVSYISYTLIVTLQPLSGHLGRQCRRLTGSSPQPHGAVCRRPIVHLEWLLPAWTIFSAPPCGGRRPVSLAYKRPATGRRRITGSVAE